MTSNGVVMNASDYIKGLEPVKGVVYRISGSGRNLGNDCEKKDHKIWSLKKLFALSLPAFQPLMSCIRTFKSLLEA